MLAHVPVDATSPNAKGIYAKVLALLLTSLTGGTRFFGKFRQRHNEALRTAAAGRPIEAERITEDTPILDSTVCARYGAQEGARKGYNPKKPGRPSHHPLKAGLGRGYVVNLWNRSGDTHTAHQTIDFYKQTCHGLPASLRVRRTLVDSGFAECA